MRSIEIDSEYNLKNGAEEGDKKQETNRVYFSMILFGINNGKKNTKDAVRLQGETSPMKHWRGSRISIKPNSGMTYGKSFNLVIYK